MKNVKVISLGITMLICFAIKAQEKAASDHNPKSKDTLNDMKIMQDGLQPYPPANKIIICAPSKARITEPLYIMDGLVIDSKHFSKLNPNDIDSIKVLKIPEAIKIYGNKGGKGAIIITTKDEY